MEVNKGEAERCRDMGADALRHGQYERAVKLLSKSLKLYPLPGVKALLGQAERRLNESGQNGASTNGGAAPPRTPRTESSSSGFGRSSGGSTSGGRAGYATPGAQGTSTPRFARDSAGAASSTPSGGTAASGRSFTDEQVKIVKEVLRAKEGGRGAHYRVLGVEKEANEAALKKSYRKLALKLHPDKNSAPHADEAFKAVGLAYATLSDPQKREIYDRFGEEDPDNRGGGGGGGRHGGAHFHGQEVSPEEIFNMFFGGGMPRGAGGMGGPGFRVYTNGFGGTGFHYAGGRPRQRPRGGQQAREEPAAGWQQLLQVLPVLMLFLLSFFNFPGETGTGATGGSKYFSLTHSPPFVNPLATQITNVKEIPYFVTDKFMRTYYRDRYQLAQVERMVEKSYEKYLVGECKNQQMYKNQLKKNAMDRKGLTAEDREKQLRKAEEFELTRCTELQDLFPHRTTARRPKYR